MKSLFLKILSVSVILLFCLSPLGAIDFDHSENIIQNDNRTDIKDVNNTASVDVDVDNSDADVKSKTVNESTDIDNEKIDIGKKVENKNITINDTNPTGNLKGENLGLRVKVDDTTYGQSPVIKVWATYEHFGFGTVYVNISGDGYNNETQVNIYNNKVSELKLPKDLAPGTYIVTASFEDSKYYDPMTVMDWFTVWKKSTNMNVQIDDCEPGEHPVVKVNLDNNLSGNLTIRSSDFSKNYTLPITGGSGEYELDENLEPGSHFCTVSYGGDYSHNSVIRSKYFLVNKYDLALDISASYNAKTQKATVKIKANESLNGDAEVELKEEKTGMTVNTAKVELVNGAGTVSFDDGLVPGNYTATVNFAGDDRFKSCEKSISFTADKFKPI